MYVGRHFIIATSGDKQARCTTRGNWWHAVCTRWCCVVCSCHVTP